MSLDRTMLVRAARAALRGFGHVEPNPMVGCIIGREDGTLLGIGHHRRFGGPHAEVEALEDCRVRGHDPRGATAWVTLEPCCHFGKQPPCTDALIRAGIARVVAARHDPNPVSAGGAAKLAAAGIRFEIAPHCAPALAVSDPFIRRTTTGMPWVIAKWAQTIDGKVAAANGDSKWISCPASRRRVHALRGRVDAILTGIGTVLADDPLLTARGVRPRRIARRVVIDPDLRVPESSALARSIHSAPVTVITGPLAGPQREKASRLRAIGAEIIESPRAAGGIAVSPVLKDLAAKHGVGTVLVEAGPGLLGRLFAEDLVDEAMVFIAPGMLGDFSAPGAARIGANRSLEAATRMRLGCVRRSGDDVLVCWRRA